MQVVHGTHHLEAPPGPVLTIGNLDGVHRGHQALIQQTLALADALGTSSAALTFDPTPGEVLQPRRAPPRIQTLEQRLAHLEATGLQLVIVEPFTSALGALSPEAFARRFLASAIGTRALVLGHDFRFGRDRAGDAALLRRALGVRVEEVEARLHGGAPISSSRIRAALAEGHVSEATALLGRPHEISGPVVPGEQRGRTLGFPTANLSPLSGLMPRRGVYAARATVDDTIHPAVVNLGRRPTFDGQGTTLEVHILGFDGDLYGQQITVAFVERIRDERRFEGPGALREALAHDVAVARACLS